ncbi:hypothetical protein FDC49_01810 [Clostridium sporogenes]|uniref:hypothetical protein n=3 Tax=Clostridium sporogenes TaxID=1509 RepID=UPI0013D85550|nr:hypothetical protein [Clostridium sporogenes]NFH30949.1 hypothetical protein [Clostridium sporogenes]NFL18530.1 hypothetical protein [Clostridium sporogenes]
MKQIKILKINQSNINNENEVIDLQDDNIVKIGTYNFLMKLLENYRDKEFEDGEQVTEFIKVMLPDNENDAREQWNNGITWEGKLYKAWFSTVGGMKQEDKHSKSICEVIFINEEIVDFKSYFENIISLGKFSKIDKTKDMYVNKKILSRFSLATSDLITEINMPNIIILPSHKIDWKRTYKTVEPKDAVYITKSGKEKPCVDYDLVNYEFDTDKRDDNGNSIDVLNVFDGGGVATPKVMDSIGKSLNRNDIDFAIIRGYGIGIKGMVTRFNIIDYLNVMHFKTGDTDYCRKVDSHYELLDMYGDWQEVTDNTLLLNESMVKLADMFKNMEEYNALLEKCNCEEYINIYNLLNKLYITKVNKKNKELEQYRRMNYQIMNALALTKKEYKTLAKQDFKLYKKILKPYEKDTHENEFKINVDYINLFYNQCCNTEDEVESLKEITNVVDKSNVLININQENVKLSYVKKNLAKLIEKKIRDMAQGKITLKATYNYIAVDPITYMNFAMTRELGDNGLNKDEFYCRGIQDGEIRTIFRNPLMAYSEVHNVRFRRNNFLDNWLCKSEEIVYFNDKSDILSLMGSADKDGDSCTMIDNEIVKNAVIEPKDGKYFCFTADGDKVPCKFDDEGRFLATYKPAGNLIGEVAIRGASVNNNSQRIPIFYNSKNKEFYNYNYIKEEIIKNKRVNIEDKKEEERYKIIKDYIENEMINKNKELQYSNSIENEILREKIKENFYKNEKDIYSLLYVSSLVIDSPKTMNTIDVEQYIKLIKNKYPQKANFLQYAQRLEDVKEKEYASIKNSTLDKFGQKVQKELLDKIVKGKKDFSDRSKELQEQLKNDKWTKENYEKAMDEVSKMYDSYRSEVDKVQLDKIRGKNKINSKLAEHHKIYDDFVKDKWTNLIWKQDHEKIKEEFNENYKKYKKELNKIDAEFLLKANEIIASNDIYSIAMVLSNLEKISERFIINFFMSALIAVDKISPSIKCEYYKCNHNEENSIEYMHETYKKVEKKMNLSDSVIKKLSTNDLVRYKLAAEVRFRNEDTQLIEDIKNGLDEKGYYDLNITNLEVFPEFKKIVEDKKTVRIKGFMIKKNGTKSINKKSFGVCIEL